MRLLGAILVGGRSTRFGSDKAAALLNGKPLIEHVAAGLAPQVDALVGCGREWPGLTSIADRPEPDQGPLGGLCAALQYARENGFDAVLAAGCDVLPVPPDVARHLSPGPATVEGQPLFGFWPTGLLDALDRHLAAQPERSMRGWIAASGARTVRLDTPLHNLNTPDDLALYCAAEGAR